MGKMLDEALYYAKRGWYVFPCREKPGTPYIVNNIEKISLEKTPYTTNGLNDATLDSDQIREWWTKWENAMIGVNAGLSGLFVIDIDKKNVNGFDTYSTWNINDSAGLKAITPSGGMHIIFTGIGKSSSNGTTGIDTRGDGGYFIAPPSKIIEGVRTGEYRKHNDWTKSPGKIPDGLMEKVLPEKKYDYDYSTPTVFGGEKKKLSRSTVTFMRDGAPEGERNSTLFKALADFAGCGYSQEEASDLALPVSDRIGLPRWEFQNVLKHAYDKPRTSSIPDSIQEKILRGGKTVSRTITFEEQGILEYAVIAALLMDNTLIGPISDTLSHEDFKNIKNNLIYKIIVRMYNEGLGVDYLTLSQALEKETTQVNLDDISKMIDDYYVNTDNIMTYANIIKEKSAIRKLEAVLDNKEKYLEEENFIEMVSAIEEDIADVAIYGGANTSAVLQSSQAVDMVRTHLTKIQNGEMPQLKTGIVYYDNSTGGIYPNELIICAGRAGEGKCLKKGTLVIMHDGSMKKVEDIFVGDKLMGVDSKPRVVLELSNGIDMLYTVRQNRAQSYTVNSKHILSLKKSSTLENKSNHGDIVNISIKEYMALSNHKKRDLKGYKTGVEFPKKDLPIEPYFLGIWLGDGTSAKSQVTTEDYEISEYINSYAESLGMKVSNEIKKGTNAMGYNISGGMLALLRDKIGVLNNKHIPFEYLTSNREDRLQLLAGLIDTDGSVIHNGYEITQKNRELLKQIKWLADSLGFRTSQIKEKICTIKSIGFSGSYYRITIHGQMSELPVKISRKKIPYINKRIDQTVTGIDIIEEGVGEYYGFDVGGDGLFLLEDFTVTHNSALALSILNNISIGNGIPTAMFSLEMSTYETISRLICQLTGLNFRQVYQGDLSDAQWDLQRKALDSISNSNIYFDDGFGMTVPEIRSKVRKLVDKGVKLVVIDQLEQIRGYDNLPPYVQFDKIAYDLKRLTLEFNIPILLNHQLNRNVTNRSLKNPEPQLADLNQAGEKPANQVWVITHKKDEKGNILKSKIKILKNRNGVRGDIPVVFLAERMLFGNPASPEEAQEWQQGDDNDYSEHSLPSEFR